MNERGIDGLSRGRAACQKASMSSKIPSWGRPSVLTSTPVRLPKSGSSNSQLCASNVIVTLSNEIPRLFNVVEHSSVLRGLTVERLMQFRAETVTESNKAFLCLSA